MPMQSSTHVFDTTCAAILVDSDGVLVDSASSIKRAFSRWSDHYGLDGAEVYRTLHGHRAIEVAGAALGGGDIEAAARLLDRFELEDAETVTALPGSRDFLEQLEGAWTLVSSGPKLLVQARLAAAGLPKPQHFVTAESVTRGKPHPDGYLLAADLNSVSPSACVALEDSTTGLRAAMSAGCQVIQVGTTAEPAPVLGAVTDLRGIKAWATAEGFRLSSAPGAPLSAGEQ